MHQNVSNIHIFRANCYKNLNATLIIRDLCILTTAQRLEIYGGIMLINVILNLGRAASVYFVLVKASHALHNKTLASILGFPIRFFDTNPIGRNCHSTSTMYIHELLHP